MFLDVSSYSEKAQPLDDGTGQGREGWLCDACDFSTQGFGFKA